MRVLHITKFFYPERGGIEYFTYDLAKAQLKLGLEVYVICHRKGLRLRKREIDGIKIFEIPTPFKPFYAPLSPLFPFYYHRILKAISPDIFHIHMPNLSPLYLSLTKPQKPLIIHWHADVKGTNDRKLSFLYHLYKIPEKKLLENASAVIVSSFEYAKSSPTLSFRRGNSTVIPLGINPGRLKRKKPFNEIKPPFILSVGRLSFYKGFGVLLKAGELAGLQIVLLGKGVKRLKGRFKGVFLDNADEDIKAYLLEKCEIFVLPSLGREEAFGLSIVEAMIYRKPAVVSYIEGSGIIWVAEPLKTGIFVKPGDVHSLKMAIKSVFFNKKLGKKMGLNAKHRAYKLFLAEEVAKKIVSLYKEIA